MNYSSFFRDNLWLPSSTVLLLLIRYRELRFLYALV